MQPLFHGLTNLDVCHTGFKSILFFPTLALSIQTEETCCVTVGDLFSYRWIGGGICFAFSCETELSWCRCSRHSLSQGTWARQFWGEAFSITCLCIPGGTNDKRGLILCSKPSFLQSLSCFEEQNIHSYTWVSTTASTKKQKDASGIPPLPRSLILTCFPCFFWKHAVLFQFLNTESGLDPWISYIQDGII